LRLHLPSSDLIGALSASTGGYLGTLKTAKRLLPKLNVVSKVPVKARFLPRCITSLHPVPCVILSPLRAFCSITLTCFAIGLSPSGADIGPDSTTRRNLQRYLCDI